MAKMIQCKACSKEIASNAKSCPSCGAKNKKPFYKKVWVWAIILIVIAIQAIGGGDSSTEKSVAGNKKVSQGQKTEPKVQEKTPVKEKVEEKAPDKEKVEEKAVPTVPTEYKSALKKAKTYSDTMSMSKAGLYDQLTSEYGEKFSQEAAQYAIDNVTADWKGNALKKAKTYQDTMAMAPNAIYDQLLSEHGEKFTEEEAKYAIDNLK